MKNESEFSEFFSILQPQYKAPFTTPPEDDDDERQPEKVYDFDKQNEVSKEAEEWFLRFASRWKEQGIILDVLDVRENRAYQNMDIDFVCIMADKSKRTCEVKGDFTETGNLFAEYAVPSYDVDKNRKIIGRHASLGWLYGSKADFIFYYYSAYKKIYLLDLVEFSAWVNSMSLKCNFERRRCSRPFSIRGAKNLVDKNNPKGSYYYGLGYIIPLREIESANKKRHFLKIYHIKTDGQDTPQP